MGTVLLAYLWYKRRPSLDGTLIWRKLKVGPELPARRCQKTQPPSCRRVWAFGAAGSDQDHTMATAHIGQDRLIPLVQNFSTGRASSFHGDSRR